MNSVGLQPDAIRLRYQSGFLPRIRVPELLFVFFSSLITKQIVLNKLLILDFIVYLFFSYEQYKI